MLTLLIYTFMLTLIGQWVRDTADSPCKDNVIPIFES